MSVTAVPLQPTRRSYVVLLWLGIVVAVAIAVWLAFHGTSAARAKVGTNEQFLAWNAGQPGVRTTASGLEYKVLTPGKGDDHPTDQDIALINYSGSLRDGTVFDASKQPTPLPVAGSIKGFSEGLKLMSKGAKYRFWIKPDLAYGAHSPDPRTIPDDSLLVFDVELIDFLPQSVVQQQMMMQQMMQGGGGAPGAEGGAAPGGK